jgi:hypothetical protein
MLYQADVVQAIDEQRRAEFVAAAEQYRLARLGVTHVAAGTPGAESGRLRGLGRRAVCALVGRFHRLYAGPEFDLREGAQHTPASAGSFPSNKCQRSPRMTYMIEAEGVVKRFGNKLALDALELSAEPGVILAVLGPTAPARPPSSGALQP